MARKDWASATIRSASAAVGKRRFICCAFSRCNSIFASAASRCLPDNSACRKGLSERRSRSDASGSSGAAAFNRCASAFALRKLALDLRLAAIP